MKYTKKYNYIPGASLFFKTYFHESLKSDNIICVISFLWYFKMMYYENSTINLNSRLILCETLVLCDSKIFDKVQNEVQNSIKISYVPPARYVPNIKFGLFSSISNVKLKCFLPRETVKH